MSLHKAVAHTLKLYAASAGVPSFVGGGMCRAGRSKELAELVYCFERKRTDVLEHIFGRRQRAQYGTCDGKQVVHDRRAEEGARLPPDDM